LEPIIETDLRFKKLIENSYDGITLFDKNFCILYRSPSAERITGWPTQERVKNGLHILVHHLDLPNLQEVHQKVLDDPGIPHTCCFREKHYNGYYIWLETTFTNMLHDTDINAIVCNFRDITNQKHQVDLLNQTLKEVSAYKYALDEACLVTITNANGIVTHANKNFCTISQFSEEELIGRQNDAINHNPDTTGYRENLISTILSGKIWKGEVRQKAKDGSYFWVDASVVPFVDTDGKPYQYITIRTDITEKKLNQEKIIENEHFIKSITDNLPAMIAYWTNDLTCKFANKRYLERYGKTSSAMIGVNKQQLVGYAEFSTLEPYIKGVLAGQNQLFERSHIDESGKLITVQIHYIPEITNEKISGFYSLTYDITAIKIAENELKKKNDQIADLLENMNDGFISLDENRCFTFANKKIGKMVNIEPEKLIGKNIWELFHKAVGTPRYDAVETTFKTRQYVNNVDYSEVTHLWQDLRVYPSGDGVSMFIRDITEKVELEKLLKNASTLARIGGWEVDLIKAEVRWSDMTREIHEVDYAYTPSFNEGINFYKAGESREIILKSVQQAIEEGKSWDIEALIVTAKGNERWIRAIGEAEVVGGKTTRIYGSFQDIDGRKKAELATEAITKEKNEILESIGDAFYAVDANWIVTYWNKMAEKVLGQPKSVTLHENLWDIFPTALRSDMYDHFHSAVANGIATHFESRLWQTDQWFEVSAYPSANGLSVYVKDITERKLADVRLIELNNNLVRQAKELAVSNADLEQFAYVASHDLQEPLRMVTSFLTRIENKYGESIDEKGKQYIYYAVDGARRMRQIILDLLEYSRVGRTDMDSEQVDLTKVIQEILLLYRKKIEETKATINFTPLPVIYINKSAIRQVFQNLISNSIKYQKKEIRPLIHIKSEETDCAWHFSVSDNGIGIEEEYFDKVFVIFQRLHNKDEYSGTGMGLAVTKKIIDNLGGKIWITSVGGEGTTFHFDIPKHL
jgi:PAS domain S-box-containing protein